MELLVALGIGLMVAAGVYLLLRERTFSVVLGLSLLSYAVNFFVFASGRLKQGVPPVGRDGVGGHAEPLAQALVLTAIVIGFAMTAFIVALAIVAHLRMGDDRSDTGEEEP
jgi:multicomponent K+:H+ antiporter subunit C